MAHACSVCKRVRQPDGSYKEQELGHTNVSHGICPDCIPKFRQWGASATQGMKSRQEGLPFGSRLESFDLYRVDPSGGLMTASSSLQTRWGFNASSREWPAIVWLCDRVARWSKLWLSGDTNYGQWDLKSWNYNSGSGLKTKEECLALADALERLLRGKADDMVIRKQPVAQDHSTTVGRVRQFMAFLRTCEHGFEIW